MRVLRPGDVPEDARTPNRHKRTCAKCGRPLSIYNHGPRCNSCDLEDSERRAELAAKSIESRKCVACNGTGVRWYRFFDVYRLCEFCEATGVERGPGRPPSESKGVLVR
jgi:NMD protein affecting ribosome stability and mRNA decay